MQLSFLKDEKCKSVCQRVYNADRKEDKDRLKFLKKGIANNYYHHWYVLVLYPGGKEHHLRSSSYMSCTGCINKEFQKFRNSDDSVLGKHEKHFGWWKHETNRNASQLKEYFTEIKMLSLVWYFV